MYSRNYEVSIRVVNEAAFRDAMDRAGKSGEDAMKRVGRSTDTASQAAARFSRDTQTLSGAQTQLRGTVQNAAFQIQDFAVQVASGQSAVVALAQQLPQLLGGLGVIGAVAGGAVAILGGLWLAFGQGESATERLKSALDDLEAAASRARDILADLRAPSGDLARKYAGEESAVRSLLAALGELAAAEAERNRQAAFAALSENEITNRALSTAVRIGPGTAGLPNAGVANLIGGLNLARDAAEEFQRVFQQVFSATSADEQFVALGRIRQILAESRVEIDTLPPALQAWLKELFEVERTTREALATTQAVTKAAEDAAGGFRTAANEASSLPTLLEPLAGVILAAASQTGTLADNFARARIEAAGLLAALPFSASPDEAGLGFLAPREGPAPLNTGFIVSPDDRPDPQKPGGGGKTTPTAQKDPLEALIDRLDGRIAQAQDRAELLRRTLALPEDSRDANRAAIEQELAFERALTDAREAGLTVTEAQEAALRATLETRLEELRLSGQAVAALQAEEEARRTAAQEAVRQQQELDQWLSRTTDTLAGAIAGTEDWSDALKQLAADLAEAALQAALFNDGPLKGLFGGGGFGFLGSLFGGSTGSTAGGIVASAKGNAFAGGDLVAFARGGVPAGGGIVTDPTVFPMRGGKVGLMAELDKEAILPMAGAGRPSVYDAATGRPIPLARDGMGRLGVDLTEIRTMMGAQPFATGGAFTDAAPVAVPMAARMPSMPAMQARGGDSFTYAPVINAEAGADMARIEAMLTRQYRQFKAEAPAIVRRTNAEDRRAGTRL